MGKMTTSRLLHALPPCQRRSSPVGRYISERMEPPSSVTVSCNFSDFIV